MNQEPDLKNPWLVAVWPGMGNVAINGGYYLMAKLGMRLLSELSTEGLFDVEHVDVEQGLIQPGRLPRSRFFRWKDPADRHDLVVFIGEAQPSFGKDAFCRKLVAYAGELGVERVFTFAAMATQMHPEQPSRVFCAATDRDMLEELQKYDLETLEDGHIGGLNGVLLGAAAQSGLRGACLLGEMPHLFSQFPFPKASQAVLEIFTSMADLDIDLTELSNEAREADRKLSELLSNVEEAMGRPHVEEPFGDFPKGEDERQEEEKTPLRPDTIERIEQLFRQAEEDRSRAYELKQLLDRYGVFSDYEDRFLDLFKE